MKLACSNCGLVREGEHQSSDDLSDTYQSQYSVAAADYTFHTPSGPLRRSQAFADWMAAIAGSHRWRSATRVLEVGAGFGALLAEMQQRWPATTFEGVELSEHAASEARRLGRMVVTGDGPREGSRYDIIYAVAVLEHVPSPTRFISRLRSALNPGGLLILTQPTQDVSSYDVYFVDHLHHFGTDHIHQYARKCGFRERAFAVGHEWMPNFSLHLWQTQQPPPDPSCFQWHGPPGITTCAETVQRLESDFQRLDQTLACWAAGGRRVGVMGLNEVYALASSYTQLGSFPLCGGLDDSPERPEHAQLRFPVVSPERGHDLGMEVVVLAVNKVFHSQLVPRLTGLGFEVYPLLS